MIHFLLLPFFWFTSVNQESPKYSQKEVIYGHKDGMALTLMVLTPNAKPNSRGIISLPSSGWYSSYQDLPRFVKRAQPLLKRGYTVLLFCTDQHQKTLFPK